VTTLCQKMTINNSLEIERRTGSAVMDIIQNSDETGQLSCSTKYVMRNRQFHNISRSHDRDQKEIKHEVTKTTTET
jgi:hypothetical protein